MFKSLFSYEAHGEPNPEIISASGILLVMGVTNVLHICGIQTGGACGTVPVLVSQSSVLLRRPAYAPAAPASSKKNLPSGLAWSLSALHQKG